MVRQTACTCNLRPPLPPVAAAVEPLAAQLADEVPRSMLMYQKLFPEQSVQQAFVLG
jgi:hypothetical protein